MGLRELREEQAQLDRETAALAERRERLEDRLRDALDSEIRALTVEHHAAGSIPVRLELRAG